MCFRTHRAIIRISVAGLLASLVGVGLLAGRSGLAQEEAKAQFRRLYDDLRIRMDDDLDAAAEYLEEQIAAAPDSPDLNVLRHSLATRFMDQREFAKAHAQFQRLLDYQADHVDVPENRFGIWMTVQSMEAVAEASGDETPLAGAVDRGLEALRSLPPDDSISALLPVSQLVSLRARMLVDAGQQQVAEDLVNRQLQELQQVHASERATVETAQAYVSALRTWVTDDPANDAWRDKCIDRLDEVITEAVKRYPDSLPLQTAYAETELLMITRWRQDDPEATSKRIEEVSNRLALVAATNRSVSAILRRIELHKQRLSEARSVDSLVGKPAPSWDVDAWVNTVGGSQESFRGDVVLLDFWAMWCGPCIATFPHLRKWREEFGNDGFEIVGVTKYYNFTWDDEKKRASQSQQKVSAEDERQTLASFLEHHQLEHPVMVTSDTSEMSGQYGVRGIPHAVLIDRQGIVQLVATGAGEETAAKIHAKITQLIAAKPSLK